MADMIAEGNRSREQIEAELVRPVKAMAYPYGDNNGLVCRAMEACGYTCSVSADPGLSSLGDDPLALPRQEISGSDRMEDFISELGPLQKAPIDRRVRYYLYRWSRRDLSQL